MGRGENCRNFLLRQHRSSQQEFHHIWPTFSSIQHPNYTKLAVMYHNVKQRTALKASGIQFLAIFIWDTPLSSIRRSYFTAAILQASKPPLQPSRTRPEPIRIPSSSYPQPITSNCSLSLKLAVESIELDEQSARTAVLESERDAILSDSATSSSMIYLPASNESTRVQSRYRYDGHTHLQPDVSHPSALRMPSNQTAVTQPHRSLVLLWIASSAVLSISYYRRPAGSAAAGNSAAYSSSVCPSVRLSVRPGSLECCRLCKCPAISRIITVTYCFRAPR